MPILGSDEPRHTVACTHTPHTGWHCSDAPSSANQHPCPAVFRVSPDNVSSRASPPGTYHVCKRSAPPPIEFGENRGATAPSPGFDTSVPALQLLSVAVRASLNGLPRWLSNKSSKRRQAYRSSALSRASCFAHRFALDRLPCCKCTAWVRRDRQSPVSTG